MVLWFEHDLYDQLQLVDALALAAPAVPELIVVGSFPGRPAFRGLGELTADELETLWPARRPAGRDTLAAAEGAATPAAAFLAAQDLEATTFLGDAWFYRALAALGTGPARLVETQAGDPLPPPPPLGDARAFARLPLRLTGLGERVLDGVQDRVALLGLDRWLGGTHLTAAAAWRWDPAAGQLLRPA